MLGAIEIAFDRRAHLGRPRLRSRSARTCGRRGLLCRRLRRLSGRVGRLCSCLRGLRTTSILCACPHRVCGLLQRAVIDSARHLVNRNDVVRHSLDVAALGSAVLRRLIRQTTGREFCRRTLAACQIARDSADLVQIVGHVRHIDDVRRDGDDVILHVGNRYDLGGDLRVGDDLILDRGDGLIGRQILGRSCRTDVVKSSCHCYGLVLDGRHRLDGLDVLPNGLDRLDVVRHGLDLVLERHDDGRGFGVGLRLLLGLLRLFGRLLGRVGELTGVGLSGEELFGQVLGRLVRRSRHTQRTTDLLLQLLDERDRFVRRVVERRWKEAVVVGEYHLLIGRNRRQDGKTQALRQRRDKRDGAARLLVLVGVELDSVVGAELKCRILRADISGLGPNHLHVFWSEDLEREGVRGDEPGAHVRPCSACDVLY